MDYEKAYKAVLKTATQWIKDGCTDKEKICLECVFPELRESEDERIRKGIIEIIKAVSGPDCDVYLDEKKQEKYIAWLEKQKEQEWNRKPCLTCQEYNEGFEAGRLEGVTAGYNKAMKEMEQKEQKPVDYYHEMWKNCEANFEGGKKEVIEHPERYGLQKPAEWSEVELEFRGEKVKVKRTFYRDDKGRGYSTAELDEEVAWNALRAWCEKKGISIYDLYPKAEWSEEDEDMINCCISSIEEAKENRYAYKETDGDTSYDREIAFLKSLRPSWKPSEEQMEAFRGYIEDFQARAEAAVGGWNNFDVMIRLYEQLKKL